MNWPECLIAAKAELEQARRLIQREIDDYPTPVAGCDAQYTYLIGLRAAVGDALRAIEEPRFVATPRSPDPDAGVESR